MNHRLILAFVLVFTALAVGLVACGDDSDDGDAATTAPATAAQSPEVAYATALDDAGMAFVDLGAAVASGDEAAAVASSIRDSVAAWEEAIAAASAAELTDDALADQRDALVASSPDFVAAWSAVADQWERSTGDGVLELVQQRTPITGGAQALGTAVEGALQSAGEEAKAQLEGLEEQIQDGLDEIESQG